MAGGPVGYLRGPVLRGLYQQSGGIPDTAEHPCDRAVHARSGLDDLPELRLRIRKAVLLRVVGRRLRRRDLPYSGALRMHARAEHRRQVVAGCAVSRDREAGARASMAGRKADHRRGRPFDLGRFARRKRGADSGKIPRLLHAGRQQSYSGLDAMPLPAAIRRERISAHVRFQHLQGVPPDNPAAHVR